MKFPTAPRPTATEDISRSSEEKAEENRRLRLNRESAEWAEMQRQSDFYRNNN